jgi:hypothetical protein
VNLNILIDGFVGKKVQLKLLKPNLRNVQQDLLKEIIENKLEISNNEQVNG